MNYSLRLLILLFGFLWVFTSFAQQPLLQFKHLTTSEGLSQSNVTCILQDSRGFMWFGTRDGLNKYDGYTFTIYRNDPADSATISSNAIKDLVEDEQGNIWIATTEGGLNKFDRNKNSFLHFKTKPGNPQSISSNNINKLLMDRQGNIWLATTESGVSVFNKNTNTFTNYRHDPKNKKSIRGNEVTALYEDKTGNIWVATSKGGLEKFDASKKTFAHYDYTIWPEANRSFAFIKSMYEDSNGNFWLGINGAGIVLFDPARNTSTPYPTNLSAEHSLRQDVVLALAEDKYGNLWIGTENGGLHVLNNVFQTITQYRHNKNDKSSLSNNSVYAITKDKKGNLWLGTYSGGINFYDVEPKKFAHYKAGELAGKSLNHNNVLAFFEDAQGHLWVGTDGGGINVIDRRHNRFRYYTHEPQDPKSLSSNFVLYFQQDQQGDLYIGSFRGGLSRIHPKEEAFYNFPFDFNNPKGLKYNIVSTIVADKKGYLWLGTWGDGLKRYDKKNEAFKHYYVTDSTPTKLSSNVILSLLEDSKEQLWIGTEGGGLDLYDPANDRFVHYKHDDQKPGSLSNNVVNVVFEDSRGRLWVGTNSGLNLFHPENQSFSTFRPKDGLPNEVIMGILEDGKGQLWISTNRGISQFNPAAKTFRNYEISDGLQGNAFNRGACYKNSKGEMFFGGTNGFNVFHPDSIKDNAFIPPVYLTNFQIFNKPVTIGGKDSPIQQHISEAKEILLSYTQSVFSFDFAALNYTNAEKNQFAYQLEGFDEHWNYIGNKRSASYTNLDAGEYIFKVKASNNDGLWNEAGTSIKLIITPPFWKTWWFRFLVAGSVLGGAFAFYRARINSIQEQKAELERQVQERTHDLQQANEAVTLQKEEIQAQAEYLQTVNEQIFSSIKYANTIQKAILPSEHKISQAFPEHFTLYRPKDVVSGDFYWFARLSVEKMDISRQVLEKVENDLDFVAVVDCTGHGVPGAFMSIIGSTLLNEIINQKQILDPAQILEELNLGVKNAVEKAEGMNTAGMDVCLCRIERLEEGQIRLLFCGAKRPLYYVRKASGELETLEADRRSIGSDSKLSFTTQELSLQKGDMLYLSSDGYADQNNMQREKMGSAKVKELMLSAAQLEIGAQKALFESSLDAHQQDTEQRDDITFMGIRL